MSNRRFVFPLMRVSFEFNYRDDDVEEDLRGINGERAQQRAQAVIDAGGPDLFVAANELQNLIGFKKVGDFNSEGGEILGMDTVDDVYRLWGRIKKIRGGGDDIIYLDNYIEVGSFLLFPDGFNGEQIPFEDWDEWIVDQGSDALLRQWQEETEEDLFENPTPEQDAEIMSILTSKATADKKVEALVQSGIFLDSQLRWLACKWAEEALFRQYDIGMKPDPRSLAAIEVARRFIYDEASEEELDTAWKDAANAARQYTTEGADWATLRTAWAASNAAINIAATAALNVASSIAWIDPTYDAMDIAWERFLSDFVDIILQNQRPMIAKWQKETEEDLFENPLQLRRLPNRRRR